jgi:hypothetical protein
MSIAAMLPLMMAAALGSGEPEQERQGRLRPPQTLTCDRNQLTSFSGDVRQWSRSDTEARITLDTDAETRESFTVRFDKGSAPEGRFLLGGNPFRVEDWVRVESSRGQVRSGMRATVWVCEGSANPVIDWRLPPK